MNHTLLKKLIGTFGTINTPSVNMPALLIAIEMQTELPARPASIMEVNDVWDVYARARAETCIKESSKHLLFNHPMALEMSRQLYTQRCTSWRKPMDVLFTHVNNGFVGGLVDSEEHDLTENTANKAMYYLCENFWKYRENFSGLTLQGDNADGNFNKLVRQIFDSLEEDFPNTASYELNAMRDVVIIALTMTKNFLIAVGTGEWKDPDTTRYLSSSIDLFVKDGLLTESLVDKIKPLLKTEVQKKG